MADDGPIQPLVTGPASTIVSYTDLQNAIGNWLDHSLFASRYPDFITLFEATANRRLRTRFQEASAMIVPGPVPAPGPLVTQPSGIPLSLSGGNDSYTKILLHMNGPGFLDEAAGAGPHSWTALGDATVSPLDVQFGAGAFRSAGAGSIQTPGRGDCRIGSSDFTVDFWFRFDPTDTGGVSYLCGQGAEGTVNQSVYVARNGPNHMIGVASNTSAQISVSGTKQYTGTTNPGWHHLAFVRTGNVLRLFIDGVQEGSDVAFTTAVNDNQHNWGIGNLGDSTTNPQFNGWIDEFRLSVGIARWTAAFTPPTQEYASLPASGQLPADYLALRRVTWSGNPRRELPYVHPSYFQASYPTQPADVPAFYTIEGNTLSVIPLDSTPVQLDYFRRIPALSGIAPVDGTQTNWLMTSHPDLYLFGALCEAEAFGVNDERMPMWKARRDEIFAEVIELSNKTRGTAAHIRVMSPTP